MMEDLKSQAMRFGTDIRFGYVTNADLSERPFKITVDGSRVIEAETFVITSYSIHYTKLYEKKYTGASYFDPVSNQMENSDETFFHCEYQKGVGLKYETETYFNMFSTSKRLLGFVINGESFGDISTNDIVTSSETLTAAPSFAIYPTVVKSGTVVNINCNEAVKTIYLSSVSGQMTEVRVKSGNYFSFPNLPSGIYLLGIKIKGEWAFKRIINN